MFLKYKMIIILYPIRKDKNINLNDTELHYNKVFGISFK